jgi:hypothetical protein
LFCLVFPGKKAGVPRNSWIPALKPRNSWVSWDYFLDSIR